MLKAMELQEKVLHFWRSGKTIQDLLNAGQVARTPVPGTPKTPKQPIFPPPKKFLVKPEVEKAAEDHTAGDGVVTLVTIKHLLPRQEMLQRRKDPSEIQMMWSMMKTPKMNSMELN